MDSTEMIVFNIISNAGDASSKFLMSIKEAEKGEFEKAKELIAIGEESLLKAHGVQTTMIQNEASGENKYEMGILMVHAQDHLMNAILLKDLAVSIVKLHKKLAEK